MVNVNLQAVYLSRVDKIADKGRGRGRGRRGGRGSRGGYGRARDPPLEKGPPPPEKGLH
jgi:ribosomal protein L15